MQFPVCQQKHITAPPTQKQNEDNVDITGAESSVMRNKDIRKASDFSDNLNASRKRLHAFMSATEPTSTRGCAVPHELRATVMDHEVTGVAKKMVRLDMADVHDMMKRELERNEGEANDLEEWTRHAAIRPHRQASSCRGQGRRQAVGWVAMVEAACVCGGGSRKLESRTCPPPPLLPTPTIQRTSAATFECCLPATSAPSWRVIGTLAASRPLPTSLALSASRPTVEAMAGKGARRVPFALVALSS